MASIRPALSADRQATAGLTKGGETMFGLGMQELIVILVILLLIFGAARLPEIGKAIGKTISEFKKGMREASEEKEEKKEEQKPKG